MNYIAAGPASAMPILLIHGFGASGFHWRRNVNVLAEAGYRVYAIDLIGFGLSSKPVIEYEASLWTDQCAAFLREVAGCGEDKRCLLAGNSIGGYVALSLAATRPELTRGIASLNGAGRFAPSAAEAELLAAREEELAVRGPLRRALDDLLERAAVALQRSVAYAGLFVTKQPLRIKQVLQQVYPVNPEAADDELVASIAYPAEDAPGLAPPGKVRFLRQRWRRPLGVAGHSGAEGGRRCCVRIGPAAQEEGRQHRATNVAAKVPSHCVTRAACNVQRVQRAPRRFLRFSIGSCREMARRCDARRRLRGAGGSALVVAWPLMVCVCVCMGLWAWVWRSVEVRPWACTRPRHVPWVV